MHWKGDNKGHCSSSYWTLGGGYILPICYCRAKSKGRGRSNSSSVGSTRCCSFPDLESACASLLNWLKTGELQDGTHNVAFISDVEGGARYKRFGKGCSSSMLTKLSIFSVESVQMAEKSVLATHSLVQWLDEKCRKLSFFLWNHPL